MKYLITKGSMLPIIFHEGLQHKIIGVAAESAGFCQIQDDGSVIVWGESISLKLKSRPDDARFIELFLEGPKADKMSEIYHDALGEMHMDEHARLFDGDQDIP